MEYKLGTTHTQYYLHIVTVIRKALMGPHHTSIVHNHLIIFQKTYTFIIEKKLDHVKKERKKCDSFISINKSCFYSSLG